MQFRTEIKIPPADFPLTPRSHVAFVGSCFAEHMGQKMAECLPEGNVIVNPHGVLYNPVSIARTLSHVAAPQFDPQTENMFLATDGLWHHWDYSTRFTAETREALTDLLRSKWERAHGVWEQADVLFITFSTDHAYLVMKKEGKDAVVANCHKQPAGIFYQRVLDTRTTFDTFCELFENIHARRPALHVVLTLSPYRYAQYGMHENQLSKARLLLLIDRLCKAYAWVSYFPAYELICDDLRDYRFYAEDLLHPNEQAVAYVWEKFTEWAFSRQLLDYAHERKALLRDLQHRILHPQSEAAKCFEQMCEERRRLFQKKWGEKL